MFSLASIVERPGQAALDGVLLAREHGSLSLADEELKCMAADPAAIAAMRRYPEDPGPR